MCVGNYNRPLRLPFPSCAYLSVVPVVLSYKLSITYAHNSVSLCVCPLSTQVQALEVMATKLNSNSIWTFQFLPSSRLREDYTKKPCYISRKQKVMKIMKCRSENKLNENEISQTNCSCTFEQHILRNSRQVERRNAREKKRNVIKHIQITSWSYQKIVCAPPFCSPF